MHVEDLKNEVEWENFQRNSPDGSFYHSLIWRKVIQKTFSYDAIYLTVKDESGRTVGAFPGFILNAMNVRFLDSIPHSDYGGPVIADDCIQQASLSLRDSLRTICLRKKIAYARFRFMEKRRTRRFFRHALGHVEKPVGIMEVDLKATSSDLLWGKAFSRNLRKKIRLIEKSGIYAREAHTRSDLKEFYNLYYKDMRQIGVSPYPYKFLESIWSILYPEKVRIWLLEKNEAIAGQLYFKDGQKSYAYLAGLDRKRNVHEAINYLRWQEIRKAEEERYRCVSFGSTPSDPKHLHHVQKKRVGGTFHGQERVWYPMTSTACILLQTRALGITAWKSVGGLLPTGLKSVLEGALSIF